MPIGRMAVEEALFSLLRQQALRVAGQQLQGIPGYNTLKIFPGLTRFGIMQQPVI